MLVFADSHRGLDPALPLYDPADPKGRLDKNDATFVDVIHTDGGIFGFKTAIGHADFYPNGGKPNQPGCKSDKLVAAGRLADFVACSHNRAWKFYAESIRNPKAFPAVQCDSFHAFIAGRCKQKGPPAYMGYAASPKLRGKFYLMTKGFQPYGLGEHHQVVTFTTQGMQEPQYFTGTDLGCSDGFGSYPSSQLGYQISDGELHNYLYQNALYQAGYYGDQGRSPGMPPTDFPLFNYMQDLAMPDPYYSEVAYPSLEYGGGMQRSAPRRRSAAQRVSKPLRHWLQKNFLQHRKKEMAAKRLASKH